MTAAQLTRKDGKLYLLWSGTDRDNLLNIMESFDGIHWQNQIYPPTQASWFSPALIKVDSLWTLAWSEHSHNGGPTHNLYMQKYVEHAGIKGTNGFSNDQGDIVFPIQIMNGVSMIVVGKTPVIAWTSAGDKQYMNVVADPLPFGHL